MESGRWVYNVSFGLEQQVNLELNIHTRFEWRLAVIAISCSSRGNLQTKVTSRVYYPNKQERQHKLFNTRI